MMMKPVRKLVEYSSSSKGAKVTLITWLLLVVVLSLVFPSAKDFESNSTESSVKGDTPSEIAKAIEKEGFPTNKGLTALLVFHKDQALTKEDREQITALSKWLASKDKPKNVESALPYHTFPSSVQEQMFSEDQTTLLFNLSLAEGLDANATHDTLEKIAKKVDQLGLNGMQFEITGPAGISADTISLFKNADLVLMLGTVILIFIILLVIYRSPLLAMTPLIIAGIVYGVVDRVIGASGKYDLFTVDGSATSIMLVLLFAVLTDYSLFVFSRYREELRRFNSRFDAMSEAMKHISEPIFFSGGTVFLAVLTLFFTVFEPYRHFAPVFSVAVVIIAIAGLTLIPSIFALMGRRAFWPFIPKTSTEQKEKVGFWGTVGKVVQRHPALFGGILLIVLLIGAFNVTTIKYSFNLLKSFPDDISSRVGFELLEEHYPVGELAPVTILLSSNKQIEDSPEFRKNLAQLAKVLDARKDLDSIRPAQIKDDSLDALPDGVLSKNGKTIKLQAVLNNHPYEQKAFNTIEDLQKNTDRILKENGFTTKDFDLHFAGQTAQQLDVSKMNNRDTTIMLVAMSVLIAIVLIAQTRSLYLPIVMVGTILLSYVATLGFGWWIFQHFFDLNTISYRIPLYTFVFMVALGIDYNIMLVSRIRENAKQMPWKNAVTEGVRRTGGVISSAGLILAATFAVLMTQPLQELFLFGFTMALGILLDTFLIRAVLLPAILILSEKMITKKAAQ